MLSWWGWDRKWISTPKFEFCRVSYCKKPEMRVCAFVILNAGDVEHVCQIRSLKYCTWRKRVKSMRHCCSRKNEVRDHFASRLESLKCTRTNLIRDLHLCNFLVVFITYFTDFDSSSNACHEWSVFGFKSQLSTLVSLWLSLELSSQLQFPAGTEFSSTIIHVCFSAAIQQSPHFVHSLLLY